MITIIAWLLILLMYVVPFYPIALNIAIDFTGQLPHSKLLGSVFVIAFQVNFSPTTIK